MSYTPTIEPVSQRRHDLDWLRVGAFGLLIFYHIGMFYVTWDWHVKSPHAGPWLQPVMGLINPWRLTLLFFISGVALRFVMDKARMGKFLPQRLRRLGIPILFGVFVWVMPQAFYELTYKGETGPDLLAFWWQYLDFDMEFSIVTPTYNHLWYVVYVLLYTLVLAALLPLLRRVQPAIERGFERTGSVGLIAAPAVVLFFYVLALGDEFPVTHALVDDWFNHATSFSVLLFGWFAAKSEAFWRAVDRALPVAGAAAITAGALLVGMRIGRVFGDGYDLVEVIYAWTVILSLLGLAQRWLNRPSRVLRYLNTAVFPYYILHQTLIVVIGAWLIPSGLPLWAEASLIVVGTVAGCGLGYELIRRVKVLRPLFGLSWNESGGNADGALQARGDRRPVQRALTYDDESRVARLAGPEGPIEVAGDAGTHGLYGETGSSAG
jgi:hypothetical protein